MNEQEQDGQQELNQHLQSQIDGLLVRATAIEFYVVALLELMHNNDIRPSSKDRDTIAKLASEEAANFFPNDPDKFVSAVQALCGIGDPTDNVVSIPVEDSE